MDKEIIIENMHEIIDHIPMKYYADILFDAAANLIIRVSASGENVIISPRERGYVFRLYNGEKFFEISDPDIIKLKDRVQNFLTKIDFKPILSLQPYPKHSFDQEIPMKKDLTRVHMEEKLKQIKQLQADLYKTSEYVKNCIIQYQDTINERMFYSTEGSLLRQVIPRITLYISPLIKYQDKLDADHLIISGQGGMEILDTITEDALHQIIQNAIELTQAPLAPSAHLPVILDPSMTGFLAHAIFGHGVQGDVIAQDRSCWKAYFQKPVASDIVNISDGPVPNVFGNYLFDDEGILPQKSPLIEKGVLTHYLHSRFTAAILQQEDQIRGNGRRQDFMHPLFPRNSNTFVEPGSYELDEMIREISDGVMIANANYGMEDFDGSFQCFSRSGFIIERGEIKHRVKGMTLAGQAMDFLKSIDAISKGPIEYTGMFSRKGLDETVPITYGGVYLRAERAFISPG